MGKRILFLLVALLMLTSFFCGCAKDEKKNPVPAQAAAQTSAPKPPKLSAELTELYQSKPLMAEMLVNVHCVINEENGILSIGSEPGHAAIILTLIPGIQNLSQMASFLPELLQETRGAQTTEVRDANLFGARAKSCNYGYTEGEKETQGIFAAAVINQSLYLMDVIFQSGCTDEEAALIINVFTSINVLRPVSVDTNAKTAAYESIYPTFKPAKAAKQSYEPVTEWVYLPYYYYDWLYDYDWTGFDSVYFEPDWNYYDDGAYWCWDWDEEYDWGFYDEYSDWYDEAYYDDYYAYHEDYDPWSDPGDGNDAWSDPGDYGYYEEEYEDNDYDFYEDNDSDFYEDNDYDFYEDNDYDFYEDNDYDF